jgi:hypothetical protein
MNRIPIWKRQIPQRGRPPVFQVIAAMLLSVALCAAWYWRAQIRHTPQYLVPGLFVALLGLAAIAITLRPPISKGGKVFWIIVATVLCTCEIVVLESAARAQLEQFSVIMAKFDQETAILGDMNANTIRLSQRPVVVNPPAVTIKPPLQLQRENFGNLYQRLLELSQEMLWTALRQQNAVKGKPYSTEWLESNAWVFKTRFEKKLDGIVNECKAFHIEDNQLNQYIEMVKLGLMPRPDGSGYMGISAEDMRRIAERLTVLADEVKKAQP